MTAEGSKTGRYAVLKTDGSLVFKKTGANEKFALELMQKEVGGYIEMLVMSAWFNERKIDCICNEDGKLRNFPLNEVATKAYGVADDCIVGDLLICGFTDTGDSVCLTDEQMKDVKEKFTELGAKVVENGED